MTSIRVRLSIERGRCCVKAEQYWMLIDTSSCKFIHDLEYLIRKKFFMGGHTTVLNLFLDDFLLPSHEKIAVIRDNDLIRVSEDKALPTFNKAKLSNDKNENPKKRKLEDSNCSKKKSKKRKCSSTKNKKEQDTVQSKIPTESQSSLDVTSRQELSEFYKKLLNEKPRMICAETSAGGSSTQTKTKKHLTKSLKKKFKSSALNCFLEKLNPSSDKRSKKGSHLALSLPLSFKNRNYVDDVQNKNGIPKPKDISGSKKKDGVTVNKMKSSSRKSSSSTSSSSCSSKSSSDCKSDTDKKNACNGHSASEGNEPQSRELPVLKPQELLKPQTIGQGVNDKNQGVCSSKQGTNHIRFDYDSEPANGTAENPSLPSRDISPACPATSNNNGINRTPILSPIQKNIENLTDNTQKKLAAEKNVPKGRCSINNFRKDVYTYKSTVLESTRMENEPEDALSSAVPAINVPEFKDFSKYQPLVGPPRVGETVAYKILEISQSYTPEVSQYKVGKVVSFDPVLKSMKLKLTKKSLSRVTGDGNVSAKFELFDDNEEEESTVPVEIPDEVEVYWTSMIDPRLVMEPANIS